MKSTYAEEIMKMVGALDEVKNLKGTEHCPYNNGRPWIDCWAYPQDDTKEAGKMPCSNKHCTEKNNEKNIDAVGGHVRTVPDNDLCYIVPLCHSCNSPEMTDSFLVYHNVMKPILKTKCDLREGDRCKLGDENNRNG